MQVAIEGAGPRAELYMEGHAGGTSSAAIVGGMTRVCASEVPSLGLCGCSSWQLLNAREETKHMINITNALRLTVVARTALL